MASRRQPTQVEHRVLIHDPFSYSSHPHAVRLVDGEWVLVFNQSVRRAIRCHPPSDPLFRNFVIRSVDQGRTWNAPRVAPGYEWQGVECAGLTALRDGTLLLNQWRFRWYTLETGLERGKREAIRLPNELPSFPPAASVEVMPWVRGDDGTYVHRSLDGGRTWTETVQIDTSPYSGGYGMRGAIQLSNAEILLPLSDIPSYRVVFLVRSTDGGRSWGAPAPPADAPGKLFEEPALIECSDGRLIMMLRENITEYLHQVESLDGGLTWSKPVQTPILGCPPHLLALPGGRLLCTYGYRYEPFSIRAVVSDDCGASWTVDDPLVIRNDLPNDDIGYPTSLLTDDGRICTLYYGQDADGVTCILSSAWAFS